MGVMTPGFSEEKAFQFFAGMCWEEHHKSHPGASLDPHRFAEISTVRWNSITPEQKHAFFCKFEEDEARKVIQLNLKTVNDKLRKKKPKRKEIQKKSNTASKKIAGYSEAKAFKLFAGVCWEENSTLDPVKFAEVSTE